MTLKVLKYNVVNETCKQMYWSPSDEIVALRKAFLRFGIEGCYFLTSESIKGTALPLEGIDDIHSGDSFPLSMFSVGDSITDDIFQENLEDTTGLFVDQARDTLDTTSASQTADGGFGDALDVIAQNFAVTLGTSLSKSFASFSTASHVECSMI